MNLNKWAIKWGVPYEALEDLKVEMGLTDTEGCAPVKATGEAAVQNHVRLLASEAGARLWRNNVGVLKDARGVPVRFGLCNDSVKMNSLIKSSDLIGIGPDGRFMAREVKAPKWTFSGTAHEQAQLNFINLVNAMGGDAKFTTGEL